MRPYLPAFSFSAARHAFLAFVRQKNSKLKAQSVKLKRKT
jgi:hypothetical protein